MYRIVFPKVSTMTEYNKGNIKTARVFAFLLDGFLSFALVFSILITVTVILGSSGKIELMSENLTEQILNKYGVLLLLRDFLFCGTSLGKRIFHLRVIDFTTHQKPPVLKRILRCLFFIILPIDAITMFIEGRSIGDRVANTIVVPKQYINNTDNQSLKETPQQTLQQTLQHTDTATTIPTPDTDAESTKMKRTIIAGAVFVFAIIVFLALICFGWYSAL